MVREDFQKLLECMVNGEDREMHHNAVMRGVKNASSDVGGDRMTALARGYGMDLQATAIPITTSRGYGVTE
ncbi:hypothetical protein GOBAR_AA06537 [Gossypium barbadense]|uniref:Uncharacterized protein n=1 Tax=Gossypium barbadense TaxID=3634 RepID=A0A2P5YEW3_GOSBA|nr:hypothetical protein GOBAR_AA06537 [Gossypium barbadense]